jgi:hypothetical protein
MVRVTDRLRLPENPVTVTWYVPRPVPLVLNTVKTEFADPPLCRVTFAGFRLIESPDGLAMENMETVPAKPFRLVTVRVDWPDEPRRIVRLEGLAEIEKSGLVPLLTVTPTCTEWLLVALAPVTVTE